MTNLETAPPELDCVGDDARLAPDEPLAPEVLTPRDVPLGGPRAMTVRRTLPQRRRSFIGAWCFLDHYGPDDVAVTGGMRVPPHPHTGLQTVSWLFSGEVEHRDSLGTHAIVRPGELNLMTAGRGISHSEDSTEGTRLLHGVQLWVVLPEAHRGADPRFEHYVPPVVTLPSGEVRVFLGSLAGSTSPVVPFSPLLGAELRLAAGATQALSVEPTFEHGFLVDAGELEVDGVRARAGELLHVPTGRAELELRADPGRDLRLVMIGGTPVRERIVMWWNFIGRDHDEVVAAREEWQAQLGARPHDGGTGTSAAGAEPAPGTGSGTASGTVSGPGRFGQVLGHPSAPLPAPPMPGQRLLPRG